METLKYKGIKIQVMVDDQPMDPRTEFDPFGQMVCFHGRYDLGDPNDFRDSEHIMEWLEEQGNKVVWLPLFLYEHSGMTMNTTGFASRWDSGQVGVIYAEIGKEGINDVDKIKALLKGEVETYDHLLTGSVYGYEIEHEGEEIGSCWGFYGDDHEKSGLLEYAKNAIDCYLIEKAKQRHLESVERVKQLKQSFAFRRRKKASRMV